MTSRTFWLCTQCYACQVRCPRGIHIGETMRNLREWAVAQGYDVPAAITTMRAAVNATYNILNEDNQSRMIWSQNLEPLPEQLKGTAHGPGGGAAVHRLRLVLLPHGLQHSPVVRPDPGAGQA